MHIVSFFSLISVLSQVNARTCVSALVHNSKRPYACIFTEQIRGVLLFIICCCYPLATHSLFLCLQRKLCFCYSLIFRFCFFGFSAVSSFFLDFFSLLLHLLVCALPFLLLSQSSLSLLLVLPLLLFGLHTRKHFSAAHCVCVSLLWRSNFVIAL